MRNYFKYLIYLYVFIGFSVAHASASDDFFIAVKRDDPKTILTLMLRGFDPNTLNADKQHGLFIALQEPSLKVAKLLIETPQTNLDFISPAGETALMIAALKGHTDMVNAILRKQPEVNKTGWTALHYASTGGHTQIIRILLDHYAYIDAAAPNGTTPLMMAAQYGSTEAVKLLLDEGADPTLKSQLGLGAVDFAQLGSHPDSLALITAAVRAKEPKGKW